VAEDKAFATTPTAQVWQAGTLGKGACADDRVVAPIIAFFLRPCGHAFGGQPAINRIRKLLHAAKQGACADQHRLALDEACVWVSDQCLGQLADCSPAHQAVGV